MQVYLKVNLHRIAALEKQINLEKQPAIFIELNSV